MVNEEKLNQLFNNLNESEKYGLKFGLFPYEKTKDLTRDECVYLMKLGEKKNG